MHIPGRGTRSVLVGRLIRAPTCGWSTGIRNLGKSMSGAMNGWLQPMRFPIRKTRRSLRTVSILHTDKEAPIEKPDWGCLCIDERPGPSAWIDADDRVSDASLLGKRRNRLSRHRRWLRRRCAASAAGASRGAGELGMGHATNHDGL